MVFILVYSVLMVEVAHAGRIVNRRVREPAKVCAYMLPDKLLSKGEKSVFGTEKYSVVIDRDLSILNDLGQRKCNWSLNQFSSYGELDDFKYYIDEFKDYIYPYIKNADQKYTILKVSLNSCQIESESNTSFLEFPKCEKPKVKRHKKVKKKKSVKT
jgi:hypothetical protein